MVRFPAGRVYRQSDRRTTGGRRADRPAARATKITRRQADCDGDSGQEAASIASDALLDQFLLTVRRPLFSIGLGQFTPSIRSALQ
jgi:hypothetical protein